MSSNCRLIVIIFSIKIFITLLRQKFLNILWLEIKMRIKFKEPALIPYITYFKFGEWAQMDFYSLQVVMVTNWWCQIYIKFPAMWCLYVRAELFISINNEEVRNKRHEPKEKSKKESKNCFWKEHTANTFKYNPQQNILQSPY